MFMRKLFLIVSLYMLAFYTPAIQAEEQAYPSTAIQQPASYAAKTGNKALRGIANIATGFLEVPKNVINVTNAKDSNVFYGLIGGSMKGLIDMFGRTGAGIADLITIPLPTKPIAQPTYIWENFDADTTYGPVFRID